MNQVIKKTTWVKCACGKCDVVNDPTHPARGVGGSSGYGKMEHHTYSECWRSDIRRCYAKAIYAIGDAIIRLAHWIPLRTVPKNETTIRLRQP